MEASHNDMAMAPANAQDHRTRLLTRLCMEPPFRIFARFLLKRCKVSVITRDLWCLSPRPAYLTGLLHAALLALEEGIPEIIAIEFGVAGGQGLVTLQDEAKTVEGEMGVRIKTFGFDTGTGLPEMSGDYRDHPDYWKTGDFPLDHASLRQHLLPSTRLILGDVKTTVSHFIEHIQDAPIGFISFDLDLYSSTTHALQVLTHPQKWMLKKIPLYFDEVEESLVSHRFAGELLAIDEFNQQSADVKIDVWRGLKSGRPFPDHPYFNRMYVAYDLKAISRTSVYREIERLPLKEGLTSLGPGRIPKIASPYSLSSFSGRKKCT